MGKDCWSKAGFRCKLPHNYQGNTYKTCIGKVVAKFYLTFFLAVVNGWFSVVVAIGGGFAVLVAAAVCRYNVNLLFASAFPAGWRRLVQEPVLGHPRMVLLRHEDKLRVGPGGA